MFFSRNVLIYVPSLQEAPFRRARGRLCGRAGGGQPGRLWLGCALRTFTALH